MSSAVPHGVVPDLVPKGGDMRPRSGVTWCATTPRVPDGDAVEAALAQDASALSCGAYSFAFSKTRTNGGGLLLTLRPSDAAVADVLDGCPADQLIPAAEAELGAVGLKDLEARLVRVLGRVLFDDVARMIDVDRQFR
jgi:hypothetical protein